jgi:hypothetical protein
MCRLVLHIGKRNARTLSGEVSHNRLPNAGGAAGHEDDPVFQTRVSSELI